MSLDERNAGRRAEDHKRTRRAKLFATVLPVLAVSILVLLLVDAVLSVAVLNQNSDIAANQKKAQMALTTQRGAITGGCERLQVVRDDLNSLNSRVYKVIALSRQAPQTAQVAKLLDAARDESPRVVQLLETLLAASAAATPLYNEILAGTEYLPPTDCDEAVLHPRTWRAPRPVPFRLVAECYNPATNKRPDPTECRRH